MSQTTPYPFPALDRLPEALQAEVTARRALNVYRMIMHTPAVAPAFLALSDALRHDSSLPAGWRELAILRVGHHYDAAYERHHHERLARAAGLSEAAIAATRPGADSTMLSSAERQILAFVDELIEMHGLSEGTREAALHMLSAKQLADLVLTTGFYQLVCNFLKTFGVPIESA